MEAHLHLLGLPSPPHLTKPSPWMMKLSPSPLHIFTLSPKRPTNLQAKGKGFGSTISDKKRRPEQQQEQEEDDIITATEDEGDADDAIPQVVFDRVLRRVLSYVTVPMASGIGLLYVLSSLKESGLWDVPAWLPFLTVLLAFGTSALGMAYGTLSTSWDPSKEGSLLGWEEAMKNWPEAMREQGDDKK